MLRFISNIPILRRFFIVFALATIIPGVIIVSLGSFYLQSTETRASAVRTNFEAVSDAAKDQADLTSMNALLSIRASQIGNKDANSNDTANMIISTIQGLVQGFDQAIPLYRSNYELASSPHMVNIVQILRSDTSDGGSSIIDAQHKALANIASTRWPMYKQDVQKTLSALTKITTDETAAPDQVYTDETVLNANRAQSNIDYSSLNDSWQQIVATARQAGDIATAGGSSLTNPIYIYTGIAFLFILLVIIATAYIVYMTITRPLRGLAKFTQQVAEGDTHERVEVSSRDEIAIVASSMNMMLDRVVVLIEDAQMRHSILLTQVEKLVREVSDFGEGDLRVRAEVTPDEIGVLADSFNYMLEELSNLVVRVKVLAREMGHATAFAFDHMTNLVQGSDQQIQQIVTAVVEVGNMATSSRNVAERAQVLSDVAFQAFQVAQGGRFSMLQTVEGINRVNENVRSTSERVKLLGERSREINNIVNVIANIAHQTNRLALDAAIQAAMAGEDGKGFGAVASDIRRLAERAKEQALMIGHIVQNVLENINEAAAAMSEAEQETTAGTKLIADAGRALEGVFSVVEQQANEIVAINQVSIKQLQSSNQVVHMMQNVSDTTQQGSTNTREASLQLERVAGLAQQLLDSVDVFKLREDRERYVANAESIAIKEAARRSNSAPLSTRIGGMSASA